MSYWSRNITEEWTEYIEDVRDMEAWKNTDKQEAEK